MCSPGSGRGPAADRPFVDRPPGSLQEAAAAAALAARSWSLGPPTLLRMGMTAIFAADDDVVLRVSRPTAPAEASIELADLLADAGIRTARPFRREVVVHGGLSVTAWERLHAVTATPDWSAVGEMVARVHALGVDAVPPDFPVPSCHRFPWWHFDQLLDDVGELLDPPARAGIDAAIDRHGWWVDAPDDVVCHGDVHPGNVLATREGTALIDWDLLCTAPAGWDHAMLTRVARWGGDPSWYTAFAAGYGRPLGEDEVTIAIAELRLVAATLMRLRAGAADPAAMPEARLRLHYWRDGPGAPVWNAV